MSDFVSNFLTYSTVTLAVAGGYLGTVQLDSVPSSNVERAAFANPLLLANEQADHRGEVEVASNDATFDPAVVRPAELHSVVFSATGTAEGLSAITPVAEQYDTGTVTGTSVNLRSGPGTGFAIAGRAAGGDKLQVTGNKKGIWVEVVTPRSGETAWIHGNYFNAPS